MKHTKGPWEACHDGECRCKQVWSRTADHPVAKVLAGEWGDEYPSLRFIDGSCEKSIAPKIEAYTEFMAYGEIPEEQAVANAKLIAKAPAMHDQLTSARAIMQKFVDKVDRGMARSIETYAEMKQWMEEE